MNTPIHVLGARFEGDETVLTSEALDFLAELHRRFEPVRAGLLAERVRRQVAYDKGERPDFRADGSDVRADDWQVGVAPPALARRWVEITGPAERKMVINALNSGATGFMADFEDANSPTWANMIEGQLNVGGAVAGTLEHRGTDGREYHLATQTATLLIRPRGWHLGERHVLVGEEAISASLFDFGLSFFHNARAQAAKGSGPFYYLPKMQSREEAKLWNDIFVFAEEAIGIPPGTIRATVLIETLPAVFEMDEILFELRDHSAGLNAGRWDYIFSAIKTLREDPEAILPDRDAVTMTVPFMRAYAELLVATCHRRGAHAIGGMAAFVPSRRDPEATERAVAKVKADKEREVAAGFDGTWVAHPDLVPVAMTVFEEHLGERPNQLERRREDVSVEAEELLDLEVSDAGITEAGVRSNVSVGIRYLAAWLGGNGAVAIDNLMEDVATAEISRVQIWQWVQHRAPVAGAPLDADRVRALADQEMAAIRDQVGEAAYASGRYQDARELFERIALSRQPVDFLTLPAAALLDDC